MKDAPVALITGASRGIGRSCATKLAKQGYRVVVHYRSDENLAVEVAKLLDGIAIHGDLSKADACKALVDQTLESYGQIDVVVNNAGFAKDQLLPLADPDDFETVMNVNLRSAFLISKWASRHMMRRKTGSFVHISSVVAHTGNNGQCLYAASKGGLESFSKSMARDLAAKNIRSNVVAPGYIATDMTKDLPENILQEVEKKVPLKRWGSPDDVAEAVTFLCGESAKYITGTTLHVNGGLHCS